MKIKYQMRGLGIGMIVTSILMGVSTSRGIPLTDAEIMARASELGMVESGSQKLSEVGTIASPSPEPKEADTPGSGEAESSQPEEPDSSDSGEPDLSETEGTNPSGSDGQGEGQAGSGESGVPDSSRVLQDGERVTIAIESGMDSYTISLMLAESGLIEDAGEFDQYLCDNAYSRKIVSGVYEIPAGTGEEEIAKIITRDR